MAKYSNAFGFSFYNRTVGVLHCRADENGDINISGEEGTNLELSIKMGDPGEETLRIVLDNFMRARRNVDRLENEIIRLRAQLNTIKHAEIENLRAAGLDDIINQDVAEELFND